MGGRPVICSPAAVANGGEVGYNLRRKAAGGPRPRKGRRMSDDARRPLEPEDYTEPRCLLNGETFGQAWVRPIPQQRIIEKLDEYTGHRDYAGAEKLLLYWLEEALQGRDEQGRLLILNELIGCYRKSDRREKALAAAEEALELLKKLELEDSVTGGTTFVNAATAYDAFGEDERALELFQNARKAYEGNERTEPELLGGLYNNMALAHVALGRFEEALSLFGQALEQMEKTPGGEPERAVTCLNMADALEAWEGADAAARIREQVEEAYRLLKDAPVPRDGYYAFVCEKCAPGFGHHGRPDWAAELMRTAEEIYERS